MQIIVTLVSADLAKSVVSDGDKGEGVADEDDTETVLEVVQQLIDERFDRAR